MGKRKHFRKIKNIIQQKQEKTTVTQIEENPWFFCALCTKFLEFKDLIDGCKCCFCQNEFFIIPWKEYKKRDEE
jgi:hypothetical protein